jgi:hypothetical protein
MVERVRLRPLKQKTAAPIDSRSPAPADPDPPTTSTRDSIAAEHSNSGPSDGSDRTE